MGGGIALPAAPRAQRPDLPGCDDGRAPGRRADPRDDGHACAAHRAAGFSLIELLVAVAVLSVLAVGATFSVGSPKTEGDLVRFRAAWDMQRALAIEGRDMRALRLTPKGMQILARRGDGWQEIGTLRRWHGRVAFAPKGPRPPGEPDIVFLTSGRSSAFSITLGQAPVRCESDGWTGLTCG